MNKTLKIIVTVVIVVMIAIVLIFVFRKQTVSSIGAVMTASEEKTAGSLVSSQGDTATSTLGPQEANVMSALQGSLSPQDKDSVDSDIDTYLQAHRSAEQPDPNDFNDSFSDLK